MKVIEDDRWLNKNNNKVYIHSNNFRHSNKTKIKMSNSHSKRKIGPMTGKKHSFETIEKLKLAKQKFLATPNAIIINKQISDKMKIIKTGTKAPWNKNLEKRNKASQLMKGRGAGRKLSNETKIKISIAAKQRHKIKKEGLYNNGNKSAS